MERMRALLKLTLAATLCVGAAFRLSAQDDARQPPDASLGKPSATLHESTRSPNQEDRLSLIAAALDARVRRISEPDCSHLVHAIYEQARLPYDYAPSHDLYAGIGAFQRVKAPRPGDLVVWRGHVGIVIKPSQHVFFSYLSSGPGIDDYETPYWKSRGRPRFYRYVKGVACDGFELAPSHSRRLVNVKR
jgi:cell wall-associated NlpC family hydrolase